METRQQIKAVYGLHHVQPFMPTLTLERLDLMVMDAPEFMPAGSMCGPKTLGRDLVRERVTLRAEGATPWLQGADLWQRRRTRGAQS